MKRKGDPMTFLTGNRKKIVLTLLLLLVLSSMFLSWFGGSRGVQEIRGAVVLFHPLTLLCAAAALLDIWGIFPAARGIPGIVSAAGILGVELYEFLFWHYETITGRFSLSFSFRCAYPEFYLGFGLTALLLASLVLRKRIPQQSQDGSNVPLT